MYSNHSIALHQQQRNKIHVQLLLEHHHFLVAGSGLYLHHQLRRTWFDLFSQRVWGKYSNQDRAFYGRLRLWKEGWWKSWTPQIVFGANDPGTHDNAGGGGIGSRDNNGGNCWFTRWYLAVTKHFTFENIGTLGAHLSFIWNRGLKVEHKNSPAGGVNFRLSLPDEGFGHKAVNGLNLMAEYDSRTLNIGGTYSNSN